MNRQERSELLREMDKLLKPEGGMCVNGIPESKMFGIDESGKHVLFVVPMLMGPDYAESYRARHPECTVITVPEDKSIDEAIWHYKLKITHCRRP